jgi:hypothetical protein
VLSVPFNAFSASLATKETTPKLCVHAIFFSKPLHPLIKNLGASKSSNPVHAIPQLQFATTASPSLMVVASLVCESETAAATVGLWTD